MSVTGGCASNSVQVCIFVCVCVCLHMYGCVFRSAGPVWGAAAAFGSLWLSVNGVDLGGLSSGAQTMPAQDYPPWDKVCDYHEKTASSSPTAKDCQACWRGGLPLISCRGTLNAGAHSSFHTHTHTQEWYTCTYSQMQFVANTQYTTAFFTKTTQVLHFHNFMQMQDWSHRKLRFIDKNWSQFELFM